MGECEARRLTTQEYHCVRCGLRWDTDDTEPPECGKITAAKQAAVKPLTLEERMTRLCERLRTGGVLREYCDDLEDLIVEVGVMERDHRAAQKARPLPDTLPENVTPMRR